MKRLVIGLIALIGILLILAMPIEPGNAATSNTTQTSASVTVNTTISVTLTNIPIDFGALDPGATNISAANNLNISIDSVTNVWTNISQKASGDFACSGGGCGSDTFSLSNLRYANASDLPNSTIMTTSYPTPPPYANWINITKPSGASQYRNTYYWLTIPSGQTGGSYQTNLYINVSKYG